MKVLTRLRLPSNPHRAASLILLLALAVLQVGLNSAFWRAFKLGGIESFLFPLVGAAFTLMDMFGLGVIEESFAAGRKTRARWWLGLWACMLVLNLVADIGAVATLVDGDRASRTATLARLEDAQRRLTDGVGEAKRYETLLADQGFNLPIGALVAQKAGLDAEIARRAKPTFKQLRKQTELQTAFVLAEQRDKALAKAEGARAEITTFGAVDADPPAFIVLGRLCAFVGVKTDAGSVAIVIIFAVAFLLKAILTVGFWVVLPRSAEEQESAKSPVKDDVASQPISKPAVSDSDIVTDVAKRARRRRPIAQLADGLDLIASSGGTAVHRRE